MSNFPSVKAKEFIKVIEKLGFYGENLYLHFSGNIL
jgi:predicted RNA binding protein YcfA (HicA-like mRNA interferase family)